ncbi:peroxisomal dehydratase [Dacryopinax primogenitus]|uniref:Peroxisomal dehydratase n=1 Tax=Dacryopinax primogenitus (strain DJM 731) TaxID=1858805 RepID=M5G6X5_DACPD|nr:peroxisomal dehydratase [Dacryopinax primogenitus]EJU01567.1 peroxisomal dehydratase [Dacryopinax primogenitus]
MANPLEKAVGYELPRQPVGWTKRDLLTYAVGIGAKKDDFPFVYELHPQFAPFPTYPVVLSLKGDAEDVTDFSKILGQDNVPGLPTFNPERAVHGSMSIQLLRPLPVETGKGWAMKRRISGVHENKSGIVVDMEMVLVDPQGTEYAKMITSSFNVGARTLGPFSKSLSSTPRGKPVPKDRAPNWVVSEKTSEEQALVYRLSGDYNPLHIDPSIGAKMPFGGVILHGLSTYGFAARAVLRSVGGNDPQALKAFSVRFTAPVKPGDTLETSIWELGPGPQGTELVAFVTKVKETGKVCLGNGVAWVLKGKVKGKL